MTTVAAMLRQVAKMRNDVQRLRGSVPAPGMVVVRYPGLSGLLRQAREGGILDDRGNLLRPSRVSLDEPRPASGLGALLWDAKKHHAEQQAAGETVAAEREEGNL